MHNHPRKKSIDPRINFHLNTLPSVCFGANQKNKMTALASDWLRHIFDISSETAEKNSTNLHQKPPKARYQRPLRSLCFSIGSEKQDGRPGIRLVDKFSTKLDRKPDLQILYQICVFRAHRKKKEPTRRPPCPIDQQCIWSLWHIVLKWHIMLRCTGF